MLIAVLRFQVNKLVAVFCIVLFFSAKIVFDSLPRIVMAGLNLTHQVLLTDEFRLALKALNGVGRV